MTDVTRDFTVAVFVIRGDYVVLQFHQKLWRWLPPGGHIEPHELPDEAAVREVLEETGLAIELMGSRGLPVDYPDQPRQLQRPEGIQVESIGPAHEHIDLIYFAQPTDSSDDDLLPPLDHGAVWVKSADLAEKDLTDELRDWLVLAFAAFRTR